MYVSYSELQKDRRILKKTEHNFFVYAVTYKQKILSPESDGDPNFEILALSRPPFLRCSAASSVQLAILPSQLTTHCLCNPTGALRFVCKAVTHVYTTVWGGVRAPRVRE